ncbi:hypothetical protein HU200_048768 [Digitaria exilis]|uniref:Protein kinase domain-containing protein n=1 Tax=Digitaria exilis TaxID=1010633 RepID=A0A835AUM3_9POAL|nr:hypothetical protein HU200_048768 [Digitaria exilis]CAB3490224.1 unnamed protein product [Digitaria exilis]
MWQLLGNAATLTGVDPLRLITMIGQAARTARHNKSDCEHLAHRVEDLAELLTISWSVGGGPVEAAEARTLAALGETLAEAHELVVSCQAHHCLAYNLFTAHRQSERFKDVDNKITSCLHNFTLVTHIVINRRLDGLMMHTNNAHRDMTTMAEPAAEAEEFTLAEIAVATNDFAVVLSAGDSGTVYKGKLHDGREVAVKRLRRCDSAEEAAFDTELDILSPLRHGNIVRLVGWCADDDGERIVVTKLMSNGSLHDHLHGRHSSPVTLTWKARVEVLLGAARGVRYLHRRAMPAHVIHGGVTSTHILLDDDASAALAGFGGSVWRTAGVESQPLSMAAIAGGGAAYGYADPELIGTGMIKPASDVYSLGVVMLETLTGKPAMVTVWDERSSAMATMTLVSFALPSVRAGRLVDVLDRRPVAEPTAWQLEPLQLVASLAVQCLCINGDDRPGVLEVVVNLEHALELICGRGHF